MLPKTSRINLSKEFRKIAEEGKHRQTQHLKVIYRVGSRSLARVGISTSKREHPRAVDRNRARRMVATAVQMLYPDLKSGVELIIMPMRGCLEGTPEDLLKELYAIKDLYISN